jgi:hypothetical protein
LSDSHNEELLVEIRQKYCVWLKATRFTRQGSLAGNAGADLILSRNPAMDRLGSGPDQSVTVCAYACKRAYGDWVDKLSEISLAYRACIIGAHALAAPQHFKVFTLLQTGNTLQTLVF